MEKKEKKRFITMVAVFTFIWLITVVILQATDKKCDCPEVEPVQIEVPGGVDLTTVQ